MGIIKLGIYLQDKEFGEALAKGISSFSKVIFCFLGEGYESLEDRDIYITDYGREGFDRGSTFFFSNSIGEKGNEFVLFRYSDCRDVIKAILNLYFEKTGKVAEYRGDSKLKILSVASTQGGSGCTTVAVALSRMFHRFYGYKVLYLNLCPIDDSSKYLGPKGKGLMKVMYYLKESRVFPISTCIKEKEGISFFNWGGDNRILSAFSSAMFVNLLHCLEGLGCFDLLMVDMGTGFLQNGGDFLKNSTCVLFTNDCRRKGSMSVPENICNEGTSIIKVRTFAGDQEYDQAKEGEMLLSFEPGLLTFEENAYDINLEGVYGMDLKALTKKIVEALENN